MPKRRITIEVVDILGTGKCSMSQKVGDMYRYPEDRGKMCPHSFHVLFPWILMMEAGGNFESADWEPDTVTMGCSDYRHQVVYKIRRSIAEG
jgi:uncharacterized repeat protein (TIGR04076 family)